MKTKRIILELSLSRTTPGLAEPDFMSSPRFSEITCTSGCGPGLLRIALMTKPQEYKTGKIDQSRSI